MTTHHRRRRLIGLILLLVVSLLGLLANPQLYQQVSPPSSSTSSSPSPALEELAKLPVKGKAPKTGYERTQFGSGWATTGGCDTRNIILHRDLQQPVVDEACHVTSGTLGDPYTGKTILFERGAGTSQLIQIDHVVALSNAWQTGAQQLSSTEREAFANDPLNLLAVDGAANQQKSDGDAATWLPANKAFRCQYVTRQLSVKQKYSLWLTQAEKEAIERVLAQCA